MDQLTWDPFQRGCLSRDTLNSLSDKWTVLLIVALAEGPLRFGQLSHTVDGISDKVLTQRVRSLEALGLVTRSEHPDAPRPTYALTELGYSAHGVVQPLVAWTVAHMDEIAGHTSSITPGNDAAAPRLAKPGRSDAQ